MREASIIRFLETMEELFQGIFSYKVLVDAKNNIP